MAKKADRFKPVILKISSTDELFSKHEQILAKTIVRAVEYFYKTKTKKHIKDIAYIYYQDFAMIKLAIDTREFLEILDKNMQTLIKYEEYELCSLSEKLKQKIKEADDEDSSVH